MSQLFKKITPHLYQYRQTFWDSCLDTFLLFIISGIISFVIGLAIGIALTVTAEGGIKRNKIAYRAISLTVNVFRSVPFVVLLIFLIPFTRALVGTAIGVTGAIVPLVFGTVPFFARQVESALASVDKGKIEAARSMGSGTAGIIFRVYLKEAVPNLIRATTITAISLIGLTTMAGAVGAGGIGSFAINYGQGLNYPDIVNVCVIVLLIVTCIIQGLGTLLAAKTTNRKLIKIKLKNKKEGIKND